MAVNNQTTQTRCQKMV